MEYNNENQVQYYIYHTGNGKVIKRTLCIADGTEDGTTEIVNHAGCNTRKIYTEINNRKISKVLFDESKKVSKSEPPKVKRRNKHVGKKVIATDLRGGASLLIAALIAEGTTEIESCEYILRGYSDVVEKLQNVGAKINLIEINKNNKKSVEEEA